jgi:hypothetical protein
MTVGSIPGIVNKTWVPVLTGMNGDVRITVPPTRSRIRAINATRPCGLNNWIQLFSPHGLVAFIARWLRPRSHRRCLDPDLITVSVDKRLCTSLSLSLTHTHTHSLSLSSFFRGLIYFQNNHSSVSTIHTQTMSCEHRHSCVAQRTVRAPETAKDDSPTALVAFTVTKAVSTERNRLLLVPFNSK